MWQLPWLGIFLGAYLVWVLLACASLLMSRRAPAATLAWIFAFVALPFVSGIYYLVFGPRRLRRRRLRYGFARGSLAGGVAEHLRTACCQEPPKLSAEAAPLATLAKHLGQGEPTFASATKLLEGGDEFLEALERAILDAAHHVHLEYYIWEPDRVGTFVRDLLTAAALRGLQIRVLCDDVGSPRVNAKFWEPLRAAGGEVRAFNALRFSVAGLNFANFRTHRKIAICDGRVGFVGGINIHEDACATRVGKDAWRDQQVRIAGEPVWRLQQLFLENWVYSKGAFRLTTNMVAKYFPPSDKTDGEATQILASGPDDETAPLHAFYLAAISTARARVWLETPYLIPDEPLEAALRVAQLRGVEVQVIVPKHGDSKLVTAASHTYCESLGKVGIKVYEYGPPMLHAKMMVIDETVGIVGTANFDNRSFRLNFEVAAAFYDAALIGRLAKRFKEDREVCKPFPSRRRNPRLTVLLESLARLTSPVL